MHTNALPIFQEYGEHTPHFNNFYRFFSRIAHGDSGKCPQVVTMTSAAEGEGKSTLSFYLSLTASMSSGERCLLIDGDLHRPALHRAFGVDRNAGLTDVLVEDKDLSQVIRSTPHESLNFITAGQPVRNPFQLLSLYKTKQLFDTFRSYYDLVVVDAPPIGPVGDALKLAEYSDGIIMVVRTGKTPRNVVKRAVDILNETHCPLLGVALNDIGEVLPYYYQRAYYGYHYNLIDTIKETKE